MLPGPPVIRKCSACGEPILQPTLLSGNNFGARYWTDGKMDAPMLPDEPQLVKCPHCDTPVWIDEQKKFRKTKNDKPGERHATKSKCPQLYETLTLEDYFAALERGVSDRQKERYLRLRTWWAGNDNRREGANPEPMSAEEIRNLRFFEALLDETDDNDRIMKAEVMRELGMFAEAEDLLSRPFGDEFAQAVTTIRKLTAQTISSVREMKSQ